MENGNHNVSKVDALGLVLRSPRESFEVENDQDARRLVRGGEEEPVELWQWALAPIFGLLVMFCVPMMTYTLYKPSLEVVLGLEESESQNIVNFGLLGGMIFGFVPGLIFDKFGYSVTLCLGGAMATIGASLVYMFLKDSPEAPPNWFSLALAFMLMCHGCRYQYFAGICAALGIFPERLAGSMSAFMAINVSLGYIVMPALWNNFFLPAESDEINYDASKKELRNLKPVARFFLGLAIIYGLVTIIGLAIAFKVPARQAVSGGGSSFAQRVQLLKRPRVMALLSFVVLSISFVYVFMSSGFAEASQQAGASAKQRGAVNFRNGIVGMCGRFFHGSASDMLRSRTPAKQAGPYIASISAVSCTLMGFFLLMSRQSWVTATYFIGFGFGGIFALFPAAARTAFGVEEVGFGLGVLFCIIGSMNFVFSSLAVALEFGPAFYCICVIGAGITILMFTGMAIREWGQ